MKHMFIYFLLIIFTSFFLSCEDTEKSSRIEKINDLRENIEKIDSTFSSLDIDSIRSIYSEMSDVMMLISRRLKKMPQNIEQSVTLNKYGAVHKQIGKFFEKKSAVVNEINYTKNQLDSLMYDTENELISKEEFEKYYQDEYTVYEDLLQKKNEIDILNNNIELFYEYKVIMAQLSDSLKQISLEN